ncbi:MAG: aldolase [Streptosporangiales bacterium]|nr:aldolase [Streptosporangiales bacterium]
MTGPGAGRPRGSDADGPLGQGADGPRGLRRAMAAGEELLGTFCVIPSTEVVELIALAGLDFVIIDMEHGPFGLESVRDGLVAARARGLWAVVRVPGLDPDAIGAALDAGADGVLVPQVTSADAARTVVAAARFAPEGERGAHPWVRASGYGTVPGWFATANREVAVLVMIEGTAGVAAVPEILEVPGLDAIFLGPVDLSHSMGVPGQTDHPRVRAALEDVAAKAAARDTATAVFAAEPERARDWWGLGVGVVACGVDSQIIHAGFARVAAAARSRP